MQEWASKYPEALERVMHCNQRIVERLEHFLSHHLMVCPEGLPQHKLWLNVNVEERATQSLIDITDSLESLRDVQSELTQLFKSLNEVSGKIDSHIECPDLGYSLLLFSLLPAFAPPPPLFSFVTTKLIFGL